MNDKTWSNMNTLVNILNNKTNNMLGEVACALAMDNAYRDPSSHVEQVEKLLKSAKEVLALIQREWDNR